MKTVLELTPDQRERLIFILESARDDLAGSSDTEEERKEAQTNFEVIEVVLSQLV